MKFCPKCDNVLLIRRKKDSKGKVKVLRCDSCGYEEPFGSSDEDKSSYTIKEKIQKTGKEKTMIVLGTMHKGSTVSEEMREAQEEYFNPDE
ncbi:DNA-directed RNA polymerase subunit M [Candidatus Bathyarchaeota archaeon]|nr:DNA-directed RNA polymerase subunit M [Candidatus Bathyarchaeota archaeon]